MQYEENGIQGWMTLTELQWLFDMAQKMESIVEIGSWKGRSTHALCSGCPGTVTAVDHFRGSASDFNGHWEARAKDLSLVFINNVGFFPNLELLKMESVEAAKLFPDKSVEMVFIDGDHSAESIMEDISSWKRKCKKLICGHDINYGPTQLALYEMKMRYSIPSGTEIWYSEIKGD